MPLFCKLQPFHANHPFAISQRPTPNRALIAATSARPGPTIGRWTQWLRRSMQAGLALLLLAPHLASAQALPPGISAALQRAGINRDAVSVYVADASGSSAPRLAWRAQVAMAPASVMKLVTTYAALDLLGSDFSWATPIYADGPVQDGVLHGNLYIKGQGDPSMVAERLWLLVRRIQGLGIRSISGDIVLDHSAFDTVEGSPGDFDGEPLKPYNAAPDALLLNFKSMVMNFTPERGSGRAQIQYDLGLADVQMQTSVPLSEGACSDWRGGLKADFSNPLAVRFAGSYPASCGERYWPIAYADPRAYARRAVQALWLASGGQLGGSARDGLVPVGLKALAEVRSPDLAEIIRNINKFSNNVMAQQVFLTLSLQSKGRGTQQASREIIAAWWRSHLGDAAPPVIENGSGLSRQARISTESLGRLLQSAWASPVMSELMSSLPVVGIDGTLKRSKASPGLAHMKTGSLNNVVAIAGFVDGQSGKRYAVVAIVNQQGASAAHGAMDAIMEWAAKD